MDILQQIQKFGTVRAGLPPSFTVTSPTQISVTGSVLNNAGIGGLILHAYTEAGRLPSSSAALPDAFGGKPMGSQLVTSVNFTNATFAGQSSNYSLRISGYVQPPFGATYTFRITCDDGARLWIDSNLCIDSWNYVAGVPAVSTAQFTMFGGTWYSLLIEHMATGGSQKLLLEYSTDGTTFKILSHATDGTNFNTAYDAFESPGTRAGSLRVGGPTLMTSSLAVAGKHKALVFGTTAYVGTLANLSTDLAGAVTVTFWVRPVASASLQTFISFGGNRHIQLNTVSQIVLSPANGIATSAAVLTPGVPCHITVTVSVSGIYSLWVNGALDTQYNGTYSGTALPAPINNSFAVGATTDSTPVNLAAAGTLFENLAVYKSVALTSTDAARLYNSGRRLNLTDLVNTNTYYGNLYAWYQFDNDGGTNVFTDTSANNKPLTLSQTVSTVQSIIPDSDSLSVSPASGRLHTYNWVGIGTPLPAAPLHIASTSNSGYYGGALLGVRNVDSGPTRHAGIVVATGNGTASSGGNAFVAFDLVGSGGWSLGQDISDSNKFKLCGNNTFMTSTPALTVDSNKRLGINTSSPAFQLDVSGSINFTGNLYNSGTPYINTQWTSAGQSIYYNLGNVGLNTTTPVSLLDVVGSARVTGSLSAATLTGSVLSLPLALVTKIGIGVSSAGSPLDVKGVSNWGQVRVVPQTDSSESALSFYRYSNLAQAAAGDTWTLGQMSSGAPAGSFGLGCYGPSGTVSAIVVSPAGNVGVSQTNPSYNLDVSGNVNFSGTLTRAGVYFASSPWSTVSGGIVYGSRVGIGSAAVPTYTLDVTGNTRMTSLLVGQTGTAGDVQLIGSTGTLNFGVAASAGTYSMDATAGDAVLRVVNPANSLMIQTGIGSSAIYVKGVTNYVGINNANPLYNLDVSGAVNVNSNLTVGSVLTSKNILVVGGTSSLSATLVKPSPGTLLAVPGNALDIDGNLAFTGNLYKYNQGGVNYVLYNEPGASVTPPTFTGTVVGRGVLTSSIAFAYNESGYSGSQFPGTLTSNFAMQLSGYVYVPYSEPLTLQLQSDDGGRLYLNGVKVIETLWGSHSAGVITGTYTSTFPVGLLPFSIDYYQAGGGAQLALNYSGSRTTGNVMTNVPLASTYYTATYFAASSVTGNVTSTLSGYFSVPGPFDIQNGNSPGTFSSSQIILESGSTGGYAHAFKSRHNPGGSTDNAIDVYLWNFGTDTQSTGPSKAAITVAAAGLGVFKTNPQFAVDVAGDVNFSGILRQSGTPYISSQWTTTGTNLYYSTGAVGINNSNPGFTLDVGGNINFAGSLYKGGTPYISSQWTTTGTNLYYSTGAVGINTSSPAFTLDVGGNINFTGALYKGGTPYISSQWTTTGTNLYYNIGAVGIGNSTPQFSLDVTGAGRLTGSLTVQGDLLISNSGTLGTVAGNSLELANVSVSNSNVSQLRFVETRVATGTSWTSASTRIQKRVDVTDQGYIEFNPLNGNGAVAFGAAGGEWMRIDSTGNMGLGTAAPAYKLDVTGSQRITGALTVATITCSSISATFASISTLSAGTILNVTFAQVSSGTTSGTSTAGTITVQGGASFSGTVTASCVGVSQTNPAYALDVGGDINFTGTFRQNGSPYIGSQWTTTGTNLYYNTGAVGIKTINPAYTLDITGSQRVTGSLTASTLTATTISATYGSISTSAYMSTLTAGSMNASYGSISTSAYVSTLTAGSMNATYGSISTSAYMSTLTAGSINATYGSISTSAYMSTLTAGSLNATYGSISTSAYMSTLTAGSLNATYGSISTSAYMSTLTVGTILNFTAGGTVGTNLYLSGTLTCASLSSTFANFSTISAGTYLNVVFNQQVSSGGTTSGTSTAGTLTVAGGASFSGTVTASCIGINQTSPGYALDVTGTSRVTGSFFVGNYTGGSTALFAAYNATLSASNIFCGFGKNQSTNNSLALSFTHVADGSSSNWSGVGLAGNTQLAFAGNGNIGVNNSSPSYQLDVTGTGNFTGQLSARSGTTGMLVTNSTNPSLRVESGTGTSLDVAMATAASAFSTSANAGDAVIRCKGGGNLHLLATSAAAALTVNPSNSVGINNSSPTYTLDVNGDARADRIWIRNGGVGTYYTGNQHTLLSVTDNAITAGTNVSLYLGKSFSGNNGIFVNHTHVGDGSASNSLTFATYGAATQMSLDYSGNLSLVGKVSISSPGFWHWRLTTNISATNTPTTYASSNFTLYNPTGSANIMATNGVITVPATGIYTLVMATQFPGAGSTGQQQIISSDTTNYNYLCMMYAGNVNSINCLNASWTGRLAAGSTLSPQYSTLNASTIVGSGSDPRNLTYVTVTQVYLCN